MMFCGSAIKYDEEEKKICRFCGKVSDKVISFCDGNCQREYDEKLKEIHKRGQDENGWQIQEESIKKSVRDESLRFIFKHRPKTLESVI